MNNPNEKYKKYFWVAIIQSDLCNILLNWESTHHGYNLPKIGDYVRWNTIKYTPPTTNDQGKLNGNIHNKFEKKWKKYSITARVLHCLCHHVCLDLERYGSMKNWSCFSNELKNKYGKMSVLAGNNKVDWITKLMKHNKINETMLHLCRNIGIPSNNNNSLMYPGNKFVNFVKKDNQFTYYTLDSNEYSNLNTANAHHQCQLLNEQYYKDIIEQYSQSPNYSNKDYSVDEAISIYDEITKITEKEINKTYMLEPNIEYDLNVGDFIEFVEMNDDILIGEITKLTNIMLYNDNHKLIDNFEAFYVKYYKKTKITDENCLLSTYGCREFIKNTKIQNEFPLSLAIIKRKLGVEIYHKNDEIKIISQTICKRKHTILQNYGYFEKIQFKRSNPLTIDDIHYENYQKLKKYA